MRRDMWRWKNLELDSMIHFFMKEVGCVGGTLVMSGLFGRLTRHAGYAISRGIFLEEIIHKRPRLGN